MLFEISMENRTACIEDFDISDVKDTEALKKRFLSAMADGWRIRGTSLLQTVAAVVWWKNSRGNWLNLDKLTGGKEENQERLEENKEAVRSCADRSLLNHYKLGLLLRCYIKRR